jgi:hypothetical protein
MMADFSGVERAGQAIGQGMANLGQQIGSTVKEYSNNEKEIKKAIQISSAIEKGIPGLAPMAQEALGKLNDPNLSQRDRLAVAESIKESLSIGIIGMDKERQDKMFALEAAKLQASIQGKARNIMTADQLQQQIQSGAKVKYVPLGNGMYEVESATANELPMFGNVTVGPDGKIQQVPSVGGNIRIPGAGAGIQNALPQGQGGMFPDNVAPTGLPIGEAAGFMPGVSVDGTPGVLPPKEQPVIPVGEVPKGDVYSVEGGQIGITRLPGSTAEIEYQTKAAELEAKQAELAKQQALTKDVTEKQQIKEKGKKNFSDYIGEMAGAYSNLYKKGGAVAGGESSFEAYAGGTETGQILSRIAGSEAQVYRDVINSMAPNLINVVRQSSEMGAKGLDSEKELKFYLGAIGDPTRPIEANLKALDVLDKAYGDGKAVSNMLIENPQLLRKVKEYGLKFDNKEEKAAGSTPLDTNPEVEQMLKELGL